MIIGSKRTQTEIVLTNPTRITQKLEAVVHLGHACEVEVVPLVSITSEMDEKSENTSGEGNGKTLITLG